jgi:predicted dehydrogenase
MTIPRRRNDLRASLWVNNIECPPESRRDIVIFDRSSGTFGKHPSPHKHSSFITVKNTYPLSALWTAFLARRFAFLFGPPLRLLIIPLMKKPILAVIVGAGHRAVQYASYAEKNPDELKIVGVADPVPLRRQQTAERFGFSKGACFESAEELAAAPRFADVVINGTMDHQHVPTSLPLLAAGYDLLLEKPFATHEAEMWELARAAEHHDRKVMICHVLRFAPFYAEIRKRVASGLIGSLISVQTTEHVSFHHVAVSFVRGKHGSKAKCRSSMLLAKCCHDLDLIAWMKSGIAPARVASFGSRSFFRPEMAPPGAGKHCMVDCPAEVEQACLYSARKHYLENPDRWSFYAWSGLEGIEKPTLAQKEAHLKELDNPYGRCVFQTDNDVVDRQSVVIEFADGCTATHNMIGGSAKGSRSIHLIGTKGEIFGNLEESKFTIRTIDPGPGRDYHAEEVDLSVQGDMHGAFGGHGGGDLRLVRDFVRVVRGEQPSISTTSLDDSIYGHLLCFLADRAMEERRVVDVPEGDHPAAPPPLGAALNTRV